MEFASDHAVTAANVWIILPVHNRRETTARCLAHLRTLGVLSWAQVLVVDDGSTDGTRSMLQNDFPGVHILAGDGQLWWCGAIRLGMQTAIQQGAGCVVWLNDDTLPQSGTLEMLVSLALERCAICGGVARTTPESFVYAGGVMHKRWPQRLTNVPGPEAAPMPLEWLHGNTVAIPAAVWRRVGLPEAHWMKQTFSDIEYTLRAHRMGIPVLLVPAAQSVAQFNDSATYWSWADPRLSWWDILSGFGRLKVWWYLPGLVYFKVTTSGMMGALDCVWICVKALLLGIYKCNAIRWLTQNIKRPKGLF
ncbi:glycosyltransferase family 2 protein [Prosthecobacter sp.]|uniref:glycosyltransferase family 2 protein n=1 Tax=Prosthecobacter sp. TaxID=1965333 RepID=UPI00378446C2